MPEKREIKNETIKVSNRRRQFLSSQVKVLLPNIENSDRVNKKPAVHDMKANFLMTFHQQNSRVKIDTAARIANERFPQFYLEQI
jgi:hypothetical protein